ncbi:hypothetical protein ACLI4R_14130 [Natrialbaceae archaeon A-chndr2]
MCLEHAIDTTIDRFDENPLITPADDSRIGTNINGPSIIRTPDWLDDPLGQYYLYFAHHRGEYIRLAYADDLRGPWEVYSPGTLHLSETRFDNHIASPDVHVDYDTEQIRLYFHGCCGSFEHTADEFPQVTDVATSTDGIDFIAHHETLGNSYFRVWDYNETYYAVANDGHLYRGDDPLEPFERKQELFPRNRHFAVRFLDSDSLQIFLTRRGDRPERLQVAIIDLDSPDTEWRPDPHPPETVMWPERDYEGGDQSLSTSERGLINEPVRALRDPAIFEEDGRTYLFYAIAGESGIAGAEIRC